MSYLWGEVEGSPWLWTETNGILVFNYLTIIENNTEIPCSTYSVYSTDNVLQNYSRIFQSEY